MVGRILRRVDLRRQQETVATGSRRAATSLILVLGTALLLTSCSRSAPTPSSSPSVAAQVQRLQAENSALKRALLRQLTDADSQQAEAASLYGEGAESPSTPAYFVLYHHPAIVRLVNTYFTRLLFARAPGPAGKAAQARLARFFLPHSNTESLVLYEVRGKIANTHGAPWPAGMQCACAVVIHSAIFNRAQTRATLVVWPVDEFYVYTDADGHVQAGQFIPSGQPWNQNEPDAPHRLTLMRKSGSWLISDDFTLGNDVGAAVDLLRAGGAPKAVWRAEQRRIANELREPRPVPAGAAATFRRFITLLNEHRYTQTRALFADGAGYPARYFDHPYGSWHYSVKSISGFDPISQVALCASPGIAFIADVSSSSNPYSGPGGGNLGPTYWFAQRNPDGHWLLSPGGTDDPWGAGGYLP